MGVWFQTEPLARILNRNERRSFRAIRSRVPSFIADMLAVVRTDTPREWWENSPREDGSAR